MSLISRSGLDSRLWLASLRRSAPVLIRGVSGFLLAWLVLRVWAFETDKAVMLAVYEAGTSVAFVAWLVAEAGSLLWMPLVVWLYVFRRDRYEWTSSVLVAMGIVLSIVSVDVLKAVFMLPRPPEVLGVEYRFGVPTNPGFPSGHTSRAFTLAAVVWGRYAKWRIPFLILAITTGISMIVIGRHFPSDVLGGAFVGISIGTFAVNIARVRSDG